MGKLRTRLTVLMAEKRVKANAPFTQEMLAEATGISQSTISKLINHKIIRIETGVIEKLCDYFNCDVGDLLFIDRNGQRKS